MLSAAGRRVSVRGVAARDRVVEAVRHPVLAVGLGLITAHLVFRAWALYGAWFYADDFAMIGQARGGLSLAYLMEPYSIHVLPLGRLTAWVVEQSGGLNYAVAASITLVLVALADLACLWMLVTLFGRRWGVLAPLALYLTSAISISGTMWWAASLNQVPHQLAIMLAVGCWVRYLRTSSRGWLAATAAAVLFGLAAYVKAALILPLLAYLLLAFFVSGSPRERVQAAWRRYWPAAALFAVVGVAFVIQYLSSVPEATAADGDPQPVGLAGNMLGRALATGLVGGPWSWSELNAPVAWAEPTEAAVVASWVAIVLGGLYLVLTRIRTGRVFLLLGGYAVASYVMLLTSRAPAIGATIGLEYRYLTDLAVIAPLCLGLATMRVMGAPDSTRPRAERVITVTVPPRAVAAGTAVVALLGTVSTVQYVRVWHDDNPGERYVANARDSLDREPLDLVDTTIPNGTIPGVVAPYNQAATLVPMFSSRASFPEASRRLMVLDDEGRAHQALIKPAATGLPGPAPSCGRQLSGVDETPILLTAKVFDWTWWARLGYLASGPGQLEVTAGDTTVVADIQGGANSLYLSLPGSYDTIRVRGLTPEVNICLDVVEVGLPVPGAPL